jgi:hypothetical protein
MRKLVLLLIIIISYSSSFSQINIYIYDSAGINYNGQAININNSNENFDLNIGCYNSSNEGLEIKFRRKILSSDVTFLDQFVDNLLSYSCTGSDWSTTVPILLQPSDSSWMKPSFTFSNGAGTASIRYFILHKGNALLDSVDVNIVNTVDLSELKDESILAYPNPNTDFLNIEIPKVSNNNLFLLFDISGKKVFSAKLNLAVNNVDLRHLKSGIYSYQISN